MADLSFLAQIPGTVDAVNLRYEAHRRPRTWLGLSQAGHDCKRYLWYAHRGTEAAPIEGRVLRLFQLGNLIEQQVIDDLRACGFRIYGEQREVVYTQDNIKLTGHIDGIIEGLIEASVTPHLLEVKSANKKKFDELIKAGSYQKWNSVYYWQIQIYMLELKLTRAAVFVYCKDDSRLFMERIKADRQATIERLQSIFEAIASPIEPERMCPRADYYLAKWCPYYKTCFGGN